MRRRVLLVLHGLLCYCNTTAQIGSKIIGLPCICIAIVLWALHRTDFGVDDVQRGQLWSYARAAAIAGSSTAHLSGHLLCGDDGCSHGAYVHARALARDAREEGGHGAGGLPEDVLLQLLVLPVHVDANLQADGLWLWPRESEGLHGAVQH